MAFSRQLSVDFKTRVITCLNRLSDRDTLTAATTELEAIARGLSNDGFAPFLTCLAATDSSDKSPVRRNSVRLIGTLSSVHGDALSPYLSKMLHTVIRRLRDPDTAVRSACVEAVSSIAAQITKPPFSFILKPIVDSIFHEQDQNSQIGASLCLAAAIEAAPDPDPAELRKLLPRLYKLVKNDCFKAKASLLSLIGSIVSVGGASNRHVLNGLVPTVVEFLSSEDWAARKAASETLGRLAVAERDLVTEFKSFCIASLDARRFDKVKAVRETMNRALDWWKEVPGTLDAVAVPPALPTKFSPKDCRSSASSPTSSKSLSDTGVEIPKKKRSFSGCKSLASSTSSFSSTTTTQKNSLVNFVSVKPNIIKSYNKLDNAGGSSELKTEILEKQASSLVLASEDNESEKLNMSDSTEEGKSGLNSSCCESNPVIPSEASVEVQLRFGNSRVGDHSTAMNDSRESKEESADLFLIHKQLRLIQTQQSCLMEFLETFIGSSQNGMNSLEKRVNGLEKVLDEMLHCLGFSTPMIPTTCRTEFLSPSMWRKQEGLNYNTSCVLSTRGQSEKSMMTPEKVETAQILTENDARKQPQSMYDMGEKHRELRETFRVIFNQEM